ncbi:MAG TPA: sigma 54-interacting transcriptional regulator, partial [Gemmatimonadaceae bacterium]|nr:sigma 54-interacting transcriptional regulator [Gemmatimonadaceae bacterium]
FTGSTNEKPGAFEMADGGTIFLDEVAEMPPDIQVKLLRAIESRTIRRLGGKKEIEVDIRILAATNRDLQKALSENDLREDLYYRLAVVELFLPPLRERIGDIKLLANEFLARFAEQNGKPMTGFDEAAWEWILSHNWPGNVRELKNAVERAVIMTRGDRIKAADIMPRHLRRGQDGNTSITVPPGATLADTRRQLVLRAFASTNGDYARTATIVGMSASDVRAEIASLLNGNASGDGQAGASGAMNGMQRSSKPAEAQSPASKPGKAPAKAAAGAAAKSKAKKR